MNDGTVGLYGNGFDVKVCAAIVVGAAVLYGGIVKCGTDVCGGIALDVAGPCGWPEPSIPEAGGTYNGVALVAAGPYG